MKNFLLMLIVLAFLPLSSYAYTAVNKADNIQMYPLGIKTEFRAKNNSAPHNTSKIGSSTIVHSKVNYGTVNGIPYQPKNTACTRDYSTRTIWYDAKGNRIGYAVKYADGRRVIYDNNGNKTNVMYAYRE